MTWVDKCSIEMSLCIVSLKVESLEKSIHYCVICQLFIIKMVLVCN